MGAASAEMPWWREPTRRQWLTLAAAWVGWVMDAFDFPILLLVMPAISREFQVSMIATARSITVTLLRRLVGGVPCLESASERIGWHMIVGLRQEELNNAQSTGRCRESYVPRMPELGVEDEHEEHGLVALRPGRDLRRMLAIAERTLDYVATADRCAAVAAASVNGCLYFFPPAGSALGWLDGERCPRPRQRRAHATDQQQRSHRKCYDERVTFLPAAIRGRGAPTSSPARRPLGPLGLATLA